MDYNTYDPWNSSSPYRVNTLRRRKAQSKNVSVNNDLPSTQNDAQLDQTYLYPVDAGADLTIRKTEITKKTIKYPKIVASYPNIVDGKKFPVSKFKRIDPKYIKPPLGHPPEFLKCQPKIQTSIEAGDNDKNVDPADLTEVDEDDDGEDPEDDEDEYQEEDTEVESLRDECITPKMSGNPTDLDIQFSQLGIESLVNFKTAKRGSPQVPLKHNDNEKTLEKYCNFDEKTLIRVAPHMRRKDVICDTVDAWSNSVQSPSTRGLPYRPIIFGGTFDIDTPCQSGKIGSREDKERLMASKRISKTFDIDSPF